MRMVPPLPLDPTPSSDVGLDETGERKPIPCRAAQLYLTAARVF